MRSDLFGTQCDGLFLPSEDFSPVMHVPCGGAPKCGQKFCVLDDVALLTIPEKFVISIVQGGERKKISGLRLERDVVLVRQFTKDRHLVERSQCCRRKLV